MLSIFHGFLFLFYFISFIYSLIFAILYHCVKSKTFRVFQSDFRNNGSKCCQFPSVPLNVVSSSSELFILYILYNGFNPHHVTPFSAMTSTNLCPKIRFFFFFFFFRMKFQGFFPVILKKYCNRKAVVEENSQVGKHVVTNNTVYTWRVKRICVFEHSVMTNFNCACPAIHRGQGSGFLSEGSSWLTACMSEQRRFRRDCADAQARLNLRCSHRG